MAKELVLIPKIKYQQLLSEIETSGSNTTTCLVNHSDDSMNNLGTKANDPEIQTKTDVSDSMKEAMVKTKKSRIVCKRKSSDKSALVKKQHTNMPTMHPESNDKLTWNVDKPRANLLNIQSQSREEKVRKSKKTMPNISRMRGKARGKMKSEYKPRISSMKQKVSAGQRKHSIGKIIDPELKQSGGNIKGHKYVRQTFANFISNKGRQMWIPYDI